MKKEKVQLGIGTAIITGAFIMLASVGGAWVTGSASAESQISKVDIKVEVIKTTEELHYKELKENMDDLKTAMQKLLDYNNIPYII